MKTKTLKEFGKLTENAREKYLERIADKIHANQSVADELLNYLYSIDETYASEVQYSLNERAG